MVRVAWMHKDALVLLEPRVHRVPLDGDVTVDVGMWCRFDVDVLRGKRVTGQVVGDVHQQRVVSVDDGLAAADRPNSSSDGFGEHHAWRRFEVQPSGGMRGERSSADRQANTLPSHSDGHAEGT